MCAIKTLHQQIMNEVSAGLSYKILAPTLLKVGATCLFKKLNSMYVEEFKHSTDIIKVLVTNDLYDVNLIDASITPKFAVCSIGVDLVKKTLEFILAAESENLAQWMLVDSICRKDMDAKVYCNIKSEVESKINGQTEEILKWRAIADEITFIDDFNEALDKLSSLLSDDKQEIEEGMEGGAMYSAMQPALHTGVVTTGKKKISVQKRNLK